LDLVTFDKDPAERLARLKKETLELLEDNKPTN
jgi:hypothetical protein